MNFDIINNNLHDCWGYYVEYYLAFRKENYSDAKAEDFIEWCEDNLYICPNCETIVLKDEQAWLYEPRNSEGVCDSCIEDGGFYD